MMNRALAGRCGIYCGACAAYRGQRDGGEALEYTMEHWKVPEEEVRCNGCQALTSECYGSRCELLKCLDGKGYRFCYECEDFKDQSCEMYERIASFFPPLGEDLRENLRRIEAGETDAWLEEQERRWSCASCGRPIFWLATKCPSCGEPVKPF